jgi:hypothetical protein
MDLTEWLAAFKLLHEKAKHRTLDGPGEQDYRTRREELARALLRAQGLSRQPGRSPRQTLRVARALQVELEGRGRKDRLTTYDISMGGFAAPMSDAPRPEEALTATVRLPDGDPLVTAVTVVGMKPQAGNLRVSFSFGKLRGAPAERLESAIFDMVLSQLGQ